MSVNGGGGGARRGLGAEGAVGGDKAVDVALEIGGVGGADGHEELKGVLKEAPRAGAVWVREVIAVEVGADATGLREEGQEVVGVGAPRSGVIL